MEKIEKLNLNITEFKSKFWINQEIKIPYVYKKIKSDMTEEELFNNLKQNIFNIADLAINQKMSYLLSLDLNIEKIKEIIGTQRLDNFKSAIYSEIKYRLGSEQFPEFSNKQTLVLNNWALSGDNRDFGTFRNLLSPESIMFLSNPDWSIINFNNLKQNDNFLDLVNSFVSDYSKIEKQLEIVENKIKNLEQTTDENKLPKEYQDFFNDYFNNNKIANVHISSNQIGEIDPEKGGIEIGFDLEAPMSGISMQKEMDGEKYLAYFHPGGLSLIDTKSGIQYISAAYIKKLNEDLEELKKLSNHFSTSLTTIPENEGVYVFDNGLLYRGNTGVENETIFIGKDTNDNSDIFIGDSSKTNLHEFLDDKDTMKVVSSIKNLKQEIQETKALIESNSNKDNETISRLTNLASELTAITSNNNSIKNEFNSIKAKYNEYSADIQWIKNKLQSTQLQKRGFLQNILEKYGLEDIEFLNIENMTVEQIEEYKNNSFEQSKQALVIYKSSDEISDTTTNIEWIEMGIFGYEESNGLIPMSYLETRLSQNEGGYIYNETNYFDLVNNKGSADFVPKIKWQLSDTNSSAVETLILDKAKLTKLKNLLN